ncbi:MAG TPA: NADH-ubiquinone oxidoreductase-F iron-sulfur binding region domain-containing protein [Actinocrinis sp.]|nr:NADH-ubiquinone oxidoreductase-F iron-sulfur binding region domain-containing protein [Actinocrinis sp.]
MSATVPVRAMAAPAGLLAGAGGPADLADHLRRHGPLPHLGAEAVLDAADHSGLTGRGGAGFPTGRKMRSVIAATAQAGRRARTAGPVLVANGCEGEPASMKDHALLAVAPHLVLDGIALAARAVGAGTAHLCVHEDAAAVLDTVHRALAERREAGIDTAHVRLVPVPNRYVASEETSLVRLLNGGPALPLFSPPRPFERGVDGRPTLVNNIETLAHLALITRHGPDWFRSAGTKDAPGTALVTVGGAVAAPGVYEIPLGITGQDLLALAGGPTEPLQAVLAGGYFGAWLQAARFQATAITPAALAAAGAAMGAGIFVALPAGACGLAETARVARYLAEQSAGQCGPCVNGLPSLALGLEALAWRGDRRGPDHLARIAPYVTGRGACRHPDGAVRLITSAMTVFGTDVRAHTTHGPCQGAGLPPLLPVPAGPPAPAAPLLGRAR